MGAAIDTPSQGGKRKLDANLNLVPYVDMLMTIMAFLILTAAWTSVNVLEVQSPTNSSTATPPPTTTPPKPLQLSLSASSVDVKDDGAAVAVVDRSDTPRLAALLRDLKAQHADRSVEIRVDDGVGYGAVAALVDVVTAEVGGAIELKGG